MKSCGEVAIETIMVSDSNQGVKWLSSINRAALGICFETSLQVKASQRTVIAEKFWLAGNRGPTPACRLQTAL